MLGALANEVVAAPEMTIVRDHVPLATIVIARHPTQAAATAAVELRDHVGIITGARLPIAPDTDGVTGNRILIGESRATRALGLASRDFASQEYLIEIRGRDLLLMGRDAEKPFGLEMRGTAKRENGKYGKAFEFDGTTNSISITAKTGFDDQKGSLEAWVRLASDSTGDILRLDGSPWSYHIVSVVNNALRYTTYDGKQGVPPVVSPKLAPGWHHLMATWDSATGRKELFVDDRSAGRALYTQTHCANAHFGIGAIVEYNHANYFKGAIARVRLSNQILSQKSERANASDASPTTGTREGFDLSAGAPHLDNVFDKLNLSVAVLPDLYDEQASAYATHHFLEAFCGIRWYGPTELALVAPKRQTLTISGPTIRRKPSFAWRNVMPIATWGNLMPTVAALWNHPTRDQMQLYAFRMRNGGERFTGTHSFVGFYDRFWEKNPDNEQVWENRRAAWFVETETGTPPQMCYSNPDFIRQVVSDARDFFNGKGRKYRESAFGKFFALGPMDNDRFCPCPSCDRDVALYANNEHFSNGKYSNYIFEFANRVARELEKTHPNKYVSVLAYHSWAKHPDAVQLRRNIAIELCLQVNNYWVPATERSELEIYGEWVRTERGRPIYLWLYPEFPEALALLQGFTAFPGFNARGIARQMEMYYRDRIRGIFPEGITTQLNEYVYNQLAFDADQDPEHLLGEFFDLYYGAAADPMHKLWSEIERTFSSPESYPLEVQTEDRDFHQSEVMAWKYLGTDERMKRWAQYLAEAKSHAATDTERARVALFDQGQWAAMVAAKRVYSKKGM